MAEHAYRTPLSHVDADWKVLGRPGEIRDDRLGNQYRMVYLAGSASYGHVFQFNTHSESQGYGAVKVSDSNAPCVGVANQWATNQTYTSGSYAWLQCWGLGPASCVASNYAAGLRMCGSTNGALQSFHVTNVDYEYPYGYSIASFITSNGYIQSVSINML